MQFDCWHKWVDINLIWVHPIFWKIFTVMCFVEPIAVCLFAICYSNVHVHLLFTKIILLHTIYSLKFLQSCFYSIIHTQYYTQHNSYPSIIFSQKVNINIATYYGKSCLIFKAFQFEMKHENIKTFWALFISVVFDDLSEFSHSHQIDIFTSCNTHLKQKT